MHPVFES